MAGPSSRDRGWCSWRCPAGVCRPLAGVVVGMLVGADRRIRGGDPRGLFGCARRQLGERVGPRQPRLGRKLDHRRQVARLVEGRNGEVDAVRRLEGQRRAALAAEAAAGSARTLEMRRVPARIAEVLRGHERPTDAARRLLAHAAEANRRAADFAHGKAHRAALAAAGKRFRELHAFTSQVVTISPVALSFASLSWMPMAASSSRRRSASLKSFALRAALRAPIRLSILAASTLRASTPTAKSPRFSSP